MPDQDDEPTPEQTDKFMSMNILLPRGEVYQRATITIGNVTALEKQLAGETQIPS